MKLQAMAIQKPGEYGKQASGFTISKNTAGNYDLKIWGRFPPGWLGALSAELSRKRISIVQGIAKKSTISWEATFEIAATADASDPASLDILAMTATDTDSSMDMTFSLDGFTLTPAERSDGTLILDVTAKDQLGFLGSLLNRMAFLFLFPEEMEIDTVNGKIHDRFRIRGVAGNPPSANAIATLQRKLEESVAL